MHNKKTEKMKRKVQKLQKQLGRLGPLMRGSIVFIGTRNKQYYFSLNKDKKTNLIYLGNKRVKCAREYSNNYKKLVEIVEEMTMLNIQLLKEEN